MSDPKLNTHSSSEMQIDNLQSNDFSLLELFFKADVVVMLVMISLIFLSIWCWTIIFNKYFKFNQILLVKTCLKPAKKSCIVLKHEAFETFQSTISENPNVECDIQIVMINDKNKVKDISKILNHPFFKKI